ncbi:MAG: hypothetical protein RL190_772 [Actinomycetota bacterium]|jgi:hypothetical protein
MILYCVPSTGIHGGIKVAYQFVDLLGRAGACAAVATPDGRASGWFRSLAPVVRRDAALARLADDDIVMFSLPHDYDELRASGRRLVFHCQGTDPLIDPILRDPDVLVLTCWEEAATYVRAVAGREPVEVGIAVADAFHYRGEEKDALATLAMPRRGREIARGLAASEPRLALVEVDGLDECEVAALMRRAGVYLATAEDEWFGLPALEAMAAGCLVFSVPVRGGMEYLVDGVTCHVGSIGHLEQQIARLLDPAWADHWRAMRHAAMARALGYRLDAQLPRVRALVERLGPPARRPLRTPAATR